MEINKKLCFTEQEFLMLAKCFGLKQFFGFLPKQKNMSGDMDAESEAHLLFVLYQKEFLIIEEKQYKVTAAVDEIFRCIEKAQIIWEIIPVNRQFPVCCIYFAKKAVLLEADGNNGRYFKCSYGCPEEIMTVLFERELLMSHYISDEVLYEKDEIIEESVRKEIIEYFKDIRHVNGAECWDGTNYEERVNGSVHTIIRVREYAGNRLKATCFLMERSIRDVIVWESCEECKIYYYSQRKLKELLFDEE